MDDCQREEAGALEISRTPQAAERFRNDALLEQQISSQQDAELLAFAQSLASALPAGAPEGSPCLPPEGFEDLQNPALEVKQGRGISPQHNQEGDLSFTHGSTSVASKVCSLQVWVLCLE